MVQVVYNRTYHRVTVNGHAGSAPYGEDLVCAAVSGLVYALEANVRRLQNMGVVRDVVITKESGNAEMACKCKRKHGATVTLIYDAICLGFAELAKEYPQYISVEIRE